MAENQWRSMENQRKSMKIVENQWRSIKINRNRWTSMKIDENRRKSPKLSRIPGWAHIQHPTWVAKSGRDIMCAASRKLQKVRAFTWSIFFSIRLLTEAQCTVCVRSWKRPNPQRYPQMRRVYPRFLFFSTVNSHRVRWLKQFDQESIIKGWSLRKGIRYS